MFFAWFASLAAIAACWLFLPHDAFFSGDAGVKLIQAENLIAKRYSDLSLDYNGRDIDPNSDISPFLLKPNLYIKDGKNYSIFPVLFPFLSSFAYAAAGYRGLYALPLLSTAGILVLVYLLSRRFMGSSLAIASMLAAVFATPLIFYALTFWEHNAAVFLVMLSLVLFLRGRGTAAGAGIIGGTAVWFRPEIIVLFPSLLVSGVFFKLRRRALALFSAAAFAPAAAMLFFNKAAYGEWFGHVTRNFGESTREELSVVLGERTDNLVRSLVGLNAPQRVPQDRAGWGASFSLIRENAPLQIVCLVAVLLVAAWAVVRRSGGSDKKRRRSRGTSAPDHLAVPLVISATLAVAAAIYIGTFPLDHSPLITVLASGGLFSFSPFLAAAFLLPRARFADAEQRITAQWLLVSSTLFILIVSLAAPNDGGIRYGARYLLPAIPIFSVISFIAVNGVSEFRFGRAFKYVFCILICCSLIIEARGYQILQHKKRINRRITRALLDNPADRVAMESWWMIFNAAPVAVSKKVHILRDTRHLARMIGAARSGGERHVAIVLQKTDTITPDHILWKFLSSQRVAISSQEHLVAPFDTYFNFTVLTLQL